MKKILTALLIPLTLLILCSCGNRISEGEVYEKYYEPPSEQVQMVPRLVAGLNGRATVILMPQTYESDEKWIIKIRDSKGNTAEICVNEKVYNETEIGEWFE